MYRNTASGPEILVIVCLLTGCGGGGAAPPERVPPLVEAVEARAGSLPLVETVGGVVRARNQVTVHPEISGTVVDVLVESGEAVERGQALVRLDAAELRERLRQDEAGVRLAEAAAVEAQARVRELEARVTRTRSLAQEKLISAQELETQEAQLAALQASADLAAARVEQARASMAESRSAMDKTVVRAPVSGRVGQRRAEVGMRVDSASPLFEVGDLDRVIVELPVTEEMLQKLAVGMPVILEARSGPSRLIEAELSRISPFLAEDSFTTIAEVDVDNRQGTLRPGNFVSARILYGQSQQAVLVPLSAVWQDPQSGRSGVFVVEEGGDSISPVEGAGSAAGPGAPTPEPVVIAFRETATLAEGAGTVGVDGLRQGDWVVVVGQHLLRERAADEAAAQEGQRSTEALRAQAQVRATSWERVRELQDLKQEDLLADFLDKQRKVAAVLGAEIPASEDEVHRILDAADSEPRRPEAD